MSDLPKPAASSRAEIPMDHEYDGISEYDNPLPRWWVWIFWATFLFAIGYFFHYHLSEKGKGRLAELDDDVRVANEIAMKAASKEQVSEESLGKLLDNSASLAAGVAIFAARCQSCHAEQGKGLIGPNLTDAYWLHGSGKLMDIFETVSNGVLAKGMPAWNKQLTPIELRNVVAYVGSLRGKNLPGKEPQGEPVGAAEKSGQQANANSPPPASSGLAAPSHSATPIPSAASQSAVPTSQSAPSIHSAAPSPSQSVAPPSQSAPLIHSAAPSPSQSAASRQSAASTPSAPPSGAVSH